LDHGFYRNYDKEFLQTYARLWQSMVNFDYDEMKIVSDSLGVGEYYKYLPLVFLWRMNTAKTLGTAPTKDDHSKLSRSGQVSFEIINKIVEHLPENMIFVIRTTNMIAAHNLVSFLV
jgi:aarF domain-containing kinase